MHGDCSIRITTPRFSAAEIADCAQKQGLLSIEIELSTNPACDCPACQSSPQAVMSPHEVMALIHQAAELGAKRVILIGASSHLTSFIEQILARQLEVEWFAGESPITPELASFLYARKIDISLDHHPAWSLQRPGPSNPIQTLQTAGYGTTPMPRLSVRLFVHQANAGEIPTIWRAARAAGIQPDIQTIKPKTADQPLQHLPSESARQLFEELAKIDREEFDRAWPLPPSLTGRSCNRHLFAVHVSACGSIYACVGVTIPLGTIRSETLRDILTLSEVLEDLRDFANKVKEPCRTCTKTTDCYGCRGSAYQSTGDYLAGDELCWKADGIPVPHLPVTINNLIPHGPSIRMVDQLITLGERRTQTRFTVPPDSPWLDEQGQLDELAYIEIIAQSFAASHGFHLTPEELAAHKGLLLGVTNLIISDQARAGETLNIEIRKITRFGDFGIVEGEVRHEDGRLIAAGQVKVWRPSEANVQAIPG